MAGMTEATMIAPVDGGFGADECRRACQADIITAVVSITIQRTMGELARCSLARLLAHTQSVCATVAELPVADSPFPGWRRMQDQEPLLLRARLPIIISKRAMQQASEHTCHKARAI